MFKLCRVFLLGGGGVGEYFLLFVYLWNCLVFFQFVLFCKGLKRSFD